MNINGYVMSKDMIVFEIQDGKIINKDLNKCPLYFKDNDSFESWIKTRAIDNNRVNSRLLKKALG